MFEVGFLELVVIFGVALIVLGPTRLPGLVSRIGRWVGKARSMARQFREQLENEVNLEELNRMTETRTKQAGAGSAASTPAPPPEFTGEPIAPGTADDTSPYAASDPSPAPTDDSFSHAHAAGDAPMPYVPEEAGYVTAAAPEIVNPEPVATEAVATEPSASEANPGESNERQV